MYTSKMIFEYLHNALLNEWDPIGVKNTLQCQEEYDNYIPKLYQIISKSNTADKIFDYLWWLETDYIGIAKSDNELAKKATAKFARKLFKLQQWVEVPQPNTVLKLVGSRHQHQVTQYRFWVPGLELV